jgi:hypothetical protein
MVKHIINQELIFPIFFILSCIITYFIIFKVHIKETFYDGCQGNKCICSKMSQKVCMNRDTVASYYDAGLITENNF